MDGNEFITMVKETVAAYENQKTTQLYQGARPTLTPDEVLVVWATKALQNNKALVITTWANGLYYELTYNGDKSELYVDVYVKEDNFALAVSKKDPSAIPPQTERE